MDRIYKIIKINLIYLDTELSYIGGNSEIELRKGLNGAKGEMFSWKSLLKG